VEHNLWTIFAAVANAVPERECIVWRESRRTFAEVADHASRFASVLTSLGLGLSTERSQLEPWQAGQDTVGLYLLNGPEYLETMLGAFAARTAPFNINHHYTVAELEYIVKDSNVKALVFHGRFAPTVARLLSERDVQAPVLIQVPDESGTPLLEGALDYATALASTTPSADRAQGPDDLYILYTGGTTGFPKGTLWRQADIWMAAMGGDSLGGGSLETIVQAAVAGPPHRFLPNAPFMHGAAQWVAMRTILGGGTLVINDVVDRLDAAEVWTTLTRERCDSTLMVGEAFVRRLTDVLTRGSYDTMSLKLVLLSGAPTSVEAKNRLLEAIPHVTILDGAGSSETGAGLSAVSRRGKDTTSGVFDTSDVAIVVDEQRQYVLAPGDDQIGWYAKRGHIPLGYLGDPEKTRTAFPTVDGHRCAVPGDRARWLSDGRIHLLGRDGVTINTGGEKVFAEEVEAALLRHPSVVDALVVGRPSTRWGEEIVAVIAQGPGTDGTDTALRATLEQSLAKYKIPKQFIRVDTVMRNSAGKPDYRWAKSVALGAAASDSHDATAAQG
jgi:acyl-CoA synthetase (AMP-forming)/AMP-acid ligase II